MCRFSRRSIERARRDAIRWAGRITGAHSGQHDAHTLEAGRLRLIDVPALAADSRERSRERAKFRGAAGLCYGCGGPPVDGRGGRCERCADRAAANLRAWYARNRDTLNAKRRAARLGAVGSQ